MKMPRNIGPVHFIGIGGIGMSGIAEILHNQGYTVQGSDAALNPNVQRLRDMGIDVHIGQSGDNLGKAEVVVVSSAIKKDNPELMAARARALPVVRRAEMLAEIMRFKTAIAIGGTHGKTTTTTLVATLLDAGNLDPTVQSLVGEIRDRRVITYGRNPQADVRLVDLENHDGVQHFSVEIRDRIRLTQLRIDGLELPMPGVHNALNATAAIAVADQLRIPADAIRKGLKGFTGVKRRFTKTGTVGGITVIDDYGHHPVEIAAVLQAARQSTRRDVIAVVQPHRYSRLKDLFDDFSACFNDADTVIVAPVYAAGEQPIPGVTHDELVNRIRARGHRDARVIAGPEALAGLLAERTAEGDYVVCLGAGNITQWAAALPAELGALIGKEPE